MSIPAPFKPWFGFSNESANTYHICLLVCFFGKYNRKDKEDAS